MKHDYIVLALGNWSDWQDDRVFDTEGISITLDTNCSKRPLLRIINETD